MGNMISHGKFNSRRHNYQITMLWMSAWHKLKSPRNYWHQYVPKEQRIPVSTPKLNNFFQQLFSQKHICQKLFTVSNHSNQKATQQNEISMISKIGGMKRSGECHLRNYREYRSSYQRRKCLTTLLTSYSRAHGTKDQPKPCLDDGRQSQQTVAKYTKQFWLI